MRQIYLIFLLFTTNSLSNAQTHNSVKIGNQLWMTENLNTDKFRNGDLILEARTEEEWRKAGESRQPAWCYYMNDNSDGVKLGKLYNWYAVTDKRGLAPLGWRIPSNKDFLALRVYLGGEMIAGKKIKSASGWYDNGNGTDDFGFSFFPGGTRSEDGTFGGIGSYGNLWCSTEVDIEISLAWMLTYEDNYFLPNPGSLSDGCYVRCLKD